MADDKRGRSERERFLFWPKRFLVWRPDSCRRTRRLAGGVHLCIGNRFALMEAKLLIAATAQRCDLELVSGVEMKPMALITLGSRA
ncbi:cytochrome P450 [Archangium lansingense]|uniref:cytochrome P450 n=1 Tax=Archangium lansingense TaxID=2995310 RepID=UPI003B7DE523